ncbi:ABC transporter ATP-binding protein [Candidatus Enterococcus ikei]|uniref:ABC transporter ATP-binding protein n=1 Tax=Candidatus Enterococcus ikei TaxID=2815326 RepID=A0ABS3GV23_9ENTE|nr:ABC transporter ATP-binding protein [Enterococcus sp. DIV0869a]MBO0439111.1 ABC transporter ATP-binding protein [Enterococcus sp. DIV0869a]
MRERLSILKQISESAYSVGEGYFILIIVTNILTIIFPIVSLFNTQNIINNIQLHVSFSTPQFFFPLLLMICLNILSSVTSQSAAYLMQRYKDILDYQFSKLILQKVNEQKLTDFENPVFYDLMQRAEQAGGVYPYSIMIGIISLTAQLFSSISYILILASWKWWTIFIMAIFPILSSIQIAKLSKSEHQILYNRSTIERKSWYYAHLLNKDENIKETRLYGLEAFFLSKFKNIRMNFIKENQEMYRKRNFFTLSFQIISILATAAVLLLLFYEASLGILLIGSLMTFISSISNTKESVNSIVTSVHKLYQDSLYAENIIKLLNYNEEILSIKESTEVKRSVETIHTIELVDVSYKYISSNRYALKNINLLFEKGKNYVLVGKNGSGKTTLIKILLGFYDNYEGEILINGYPLKEIDETSYKHSLTAIFQDYTKYQFTVNEAIGISDKEAIDEKKVLEAAEKANCTETIEKLPLGYCQQLGYWFENGIQLSGGEWQKLAIARAFYKKNAQVIVMDEPSSALDPLAEKDIYQNFNTLSQDKIGLFITHRLKNFNIKGEIIVLDNGSVLEEGTQAELLENNGLFHDLYLAENTIE